MKATKKIVGAACALVAAVALSAGTTFAWFAQNNTVTADSMQVKANTNSPYLIIKQGTTLSGKATTASSTINAALLPVAPVGDLTSTNITTVTSWGTGSSDDPNDANTGSTVTPLDGSATLSEYVATDSFMVGIVENSGTVQKDLVLSEVSITDYNDGITVVVVCGNNIYSHSTQVTSGAEKLADKSLVTKDGVQVDVYIYIDGKNENVKSSNAANLSGTVTLKFSIA